MTQDPYTLEEPERPISAHPPAGWYPDPQDHGSTRYWDGRAWTEHTGPAASGTLSSPVPGEAGQGYGTSPYVGGAGYGASYGTPGGQEAAPYGAPPVQRTNGFAIASLVLGIVWLFWLGSILALIFGYIAQGQIKNSEERQGGHGLALAGIVLGWTGVATLLLWIVWFVFLVILGSTAP